MIGRTLLTTNTLTGVRVSADGAPQQKAGGVTLDWTTVAAASGDQTLPDGSVIKDTQKYLRYGQVICKITGATNTVTETGAPTGGTFTLVVTTSRPIAGAASQTTAAIAQAATAAAVQTAIAALSNVGTGNVTVSGSAGGPYTLVFSDALGTVTVTRGTNSLSGGTTPDVAIGATLTAGTTVGYFGPYDPAATDGRQTLTRGECYVVDETVTQYPGGLTTLSGANDLIGGCIEGGLVWRDRILHSGTGTHSLAAGPTFAEMAAAFPAFRFVEF